MEPPTAPRLGRCRGKAWVRVSHGLHRPLADLDETRADLCAWALTLPPSGAFTHLTAARDYGWWLPPLPGDLPVFACQAASDPRPRREGLRVTRHPCPVPVVVRSGLPMTPPAETLLACARDLRLLDLVVLIDAALHLKSCDRSDVELVSSVRRAGAPLLRRALELADGRSESAWETLLRMLHVVCDVPVDPQHLVFAADGAFVARGDVWFVGTRTLHEYDGGDHLKRPRQRKDLRRARDLSNIDWVRRGYTSQEVLAQAVTILREADLSLGRRHRPERVRAWYALLADSLFTPSGTARFRRRLGLRTHPEEWS
ncbi:MAG: hypothetical protein ACXVXG_15680 [Nocardioidaceae bacterium]